MQLSDESAKGVTAILGYAKDEWYSLKDEDEEVREHKWNTRIGGTVKVGRVIASSCMSASALYALRSLGILSKNSKLNPLDMIAIYVASPIALIQRTLNRKRRMRRKL